MSLKNITIGIDFDDVLSDLNSRAIEMANEEYGLNLELKEKNLEYKLLIHHIQQISPTLN